MDQGAGDRVTDYGYRLPITIAGVAIDVGDFGPDGRGSGQNEDVAVAHAKVLSAGGGGTGYLADGGVGARVRDWVAEGGADGGIVAPNEAKATGGFEGSGDVGTGIFIHPFLPIIG